MQLAGIAIGLATLVLIGFGHAWVKWLLRYLGARTAPFVAVLGIGLIGASLFVNDWFISALLGIAGFTTVWGAREIVQHRKEYEFKSN
jgi:hypothetical protein